MKKATKFYKENCVVLEKCLNTSNFNSQVGNNKWKSQLPVYSILGRAAFTRRPKPMHTPADILVYRMTSDLLDSFFAEVISID